MLQIKRTEGVSTTDIVGRMLTCTRVNPHMNKEAADQVGRAQRTHVWVDILCHAGGLACTFCCMMVVDQAGS